MNCAYCHKPKEAVFHRPSHECPIPGCKFDLETDDGGPTGNPEKPHPTPHHTFVPESSK